MLEESTGNFSAARNVYDWYQTNTHVIINVMIKNLNESDVKVKLIDETLDVTCNLADGSEFHLHFNLFKSIFVGESSWSVSPSKLEIKLKKTDRKRWQSLEVIPDKGHKRTVATHGFSQAKKQNTTANYGQSSIAYWSTNLTNSVIDEQSTINKSHVNYDWYQSQDDVIISVNVADLDPNDIAVHFHEKALDCCCKLIDNPTQQYNLHLNLLRAVNIAECSWKVTASKLEITLKKEESKRWSCLEADGQLLTNKNRSQQTTSIMKSDSPEPSVSTHDLVPIICNDSDSNTINSEVDNNTYIFEASVVNDDDINNSLEQHQNDVTEYNSDDKELANIESKVMEFKERESKAADDTADLFREIYEKGGEEVRRAMDKSFNNDTVAGTNTDTTNWTEVKVENDDNHEMILPEGIDLQTQISTDTNT